MNLPIRLAALISAIFMAGCTNFLELRQELREARSELGRIAGTVISPACENCPTILVALDHTDSQTVHTYRVYERPGNFAMVTSGDSRYLFGFNDLNNDFQFQESEPSGWTRLPDEFSAGKRIDNIKLTLRKRNDGPAPAFGNLFDLRGVTLGAIDVGLGVHASLDDARFDPDKAWLGMWQPLRFMKEGYSGIYFLEEYDPGKTPVLFVHGINGSPRDFSTMIASLDRQRFQPWVLAYPSGLELGAMGDGMYGMMTELHHRFPFRKLHIVAHSMGGLVSRSYLNVCAKSRNCGYLRSFTSISSPFGGHASAQSGVDYAPVAIPVWNSMAPGSRFLSGLFGEALPPSVPHNLVFGFRNNVLVGRTSGDGTVSLASQLRLDAQNQASSMRGFDEDHLSILESDAVLAHVGQLLAAQR